MQGHREYAERPTSDSLFWPVVWAVTLHVLLFGMLFVSFAFAPDLPPARPIVQATLYQLKSKSPATVQTNQKIAGEAQQTAARQYEVEQLEQKKVEQQKQAAAKAAEQKKAQEAQKAEQAKAEAAKAEAARKAEEQKKAIAKKNADEAKKKAAEEAKKKAEDAKKKAEADAKKKADAEKKKAEDAKKKAAEDAKKKADAARKSAEDRKAQALAELLADDTQRQAAIADELGDEVAGNLDDLIRLRAAEGWNRPPSARNGMAVQVRVNMLPDGTITAAAVARSSGDPAFDSSAVAAVRNIGRITEMQQLKPNEFNRYRSFTMTFTPEDLAL
jgi:colicin import membrane protein